MAAYFRECARFGVIVDWREEDRCSEYFRFDDVMLFCNDLLLLVITCPDKQSYDVCGTSCPRTCFDTSYNCENDHCIEGCHCPSGICLRFFDVKPKKVVLNNQNKLTMKINVFFDCFIGTYLHNGTCVKRNECPCQFGRREYSPGSKIRRDCNRWSVVV